MHHSRESVGLATQAFSMLPRGLSPKLEKGPKCNLLIRAQDQPSCLRACSFRFSQSFSPALILLPRKANCTDLLHEVVLAVLQGGTRFGRRPAWNGEDGQRETLFDQCFLSLFRGGIKPTRSAYDITDLFKPKRLLLLYISEINYFL